MMTMSMVAAQIALIPINNPLLPFLISKARVVKSKHTYVKYIDLEIFSDPLIAMEYNIETLESKLKEKNDSLLPLTDIFQHLKYLHTKAQNKQQNLKPVHRQKRGIINPVGKIYKWAFGLLDSDDGERFEKAIETLDKNQQQIHNDLENMLTVTKHFMNETSTVITKIVSNQNQLFGQIKLLQNNLSKYELFLMIRNWIDVMIIDCQNIIEILDVLENSVLFAKINIIHNNILDLSELDEILKLLKKLYPNELINFNYKQSNLEIIRVETQYLNNKILFKFHVPLVKENLFDYYQLFPIPNDHKVLIPPEPYIILDTEEHYFLHEACHNVEEYCIYFNQNPVILPSCIPQLLRGNQIGNCSVITINNIKKTLIEPVNDANVIIIPAEKEKIAKLCPHQEYVEINQPHLIKIPNGCQIKVNNYTFQNIGANIESKQIELLPVKTQIQLSSRNSPLVLQDVHTDRLSDIVKSAQNIHISDLESVEIKDTSNNIILYITLTIVVILCLFVLWRYCLKNKKQLIHLPFKINRKIKKQEEDIPMKTDNTRENKIHPLFSI